MTIMPQVRDIVDMKLHNRDTVWKLILSMRPVSRAQLAKITGMSASTITRIVGELAASGLLVEKDDTGRGIGRKASMLDIDRDALLTLGVNIDVDSVQTCLLDLDNMPRSVLERPFRGGRPPPEKMASIAHEMHREMLAAAGIPAAAVRAAGVGIGGIIDRARGEVVVSRQLRWRNVPLREIFGAELGLPVSVENDVKAAVAEEYARHPECRAATVAYLSVGGGVGAALMCDGKVLRGSNNAAGLITHVVAEPGGAPCDCGLRGCLYACLSELALADRIRARARPALSGPVPAAAHWAEARRQGRLWAVELGEEAAGHIAVAINQILCSYNPEIVIVGGRLFADQPDLLELALAQKNRIYSDLKKGVRIIPSLSNSMDTVIGAAIVAQGDCLEKLLLEK